MGRGLGGLGRLSNCTRRSLRADGSNPGDCWQWMLIHLLTNSRTLLTQSEGLWRGWRVEMQLIFPASVQISPKLEKPWSVRCRLSCLSFGNLIPFIFTGKVSWLSLSGKGKGTIKTATSTEVFQCSVCHWRTVPICCLRWFAANCWSYRDLIIHGPHLVSQQLTVS